MSGFRSETTAQQETYWAEDDNWTKEVSFPTLFPRSFVAWKKKPKKHPVPFPNKAFICSNSGHIICSKITDTEFGSSVRDWWDLVAKVQCHTNAAELLTGPTSLEKHNNHHYCSSHK